MTGSLVQKPSFGYLADERGIKGKSIHARGGVEGCKGG
jgi:hypothetical protein